MIICPFCEGDVVKRARVNGSKKVYNICLECESLWDGEIMAEGGDTLKNFLESKGIDYPNVKIDVIGEA